MVIFSHSLKFLEIIAEAQQRQFGIDSVRFDGLTPPIRRAAIPKNFETSNAAVPLLITAGVGKFSLIYFEYTDILAGSVG